MFQNLFDDIPMAGQAPRPPAGPGYIPSVRPADPRLPYQVRRERAGATRDENQASASQYDRDIAEANARRATAEAQRAEAEARRLGEERQGLSEGQQRANERTQRQALVERATQAQISAERNFRENAQGGAPYWMEGWLPTPGNSTFDRSGEQLIDATQGIFRTPGQGPQDQREFGAMRSARLPQSFQSDQENRQILDYTRTGIDQARAAAGLPPMNWEDAILGQQEAPPNGPEQGMVPPPPQGGQPPAGMDRGQRRVTGQTGGEYSQEIDNSGGDGQRVDPALRGAAAQIGRMLAEGQPDGVIRRYVNESGIGRTNIDWLLRYRRGAVRPPRGAPTFRQWQESNPGQPYPIDSSTFITDAPPSATRGITSALDGHYGAATAAFANATVAPAINAFNPNAEQWRAGMGALRNDYPGSTLVGDVAGTAASYSGAGRLARAVPGVASMIARHPNWAMRGGDAAYGAYRAVGENDPMMIPANVIGGMAGRGLVRGGGEAVRGVRDPLARYLDRNGVTMTLGQMARRGTGPMARFVSRAEDTARGFPIVGDLLAARHGEGIEQFNQAAFREGANPIGANIDGIGHDAVGQGQRAVSGAYDAALNGRNFTRDPTFDAAWAAAQSAARNIPVVGRDALDVLNNRVIPEFGPGGTLTGQGFQSARQTVRSASPPATASSNQQFRYRAAMSQAEQALTELAERQAPDVMPGLRSADEAYRNLSILGDAADRGRNALGDQPFLPSQLGDAARSNTINYGGRNRVRRGAIPFRQLTEAGRQILPSRLPDSGSPGRAALGLGAIGAVGAGAGGANAYANDGSIAGGAGAGGLGSLLATIALLSPNTRLGAQGVQAALLRRSPAMRRIGNYLVNDIPYVNPSIDAPYVGGMFGRAAVPDYLREDRY